MEYKTFLNKVREAVQNRLKPGESAELRSVLKNNGILLDGLTLSVPGTPFSPTIYLNAYYEEMEEGLPLEAIVSQILLLYEEQSYPRDLGRKLSSLEDMREQVVYKLIGAADNEELLADIPHYRYLDLAVVFYLIVAEDGAGQMTAVIHNEHLTLWNVRKEQLLELAEANTPALMPPLIRPIEEVILENEPEAGELCEGLPPIDLYVLTNPSGLNGAACLLYPGVLKNFADAEEDDLILLPSSIHEVLLAPSKKALTPEELNEMIKLINMSEVTPEDRLSDHIYRYCRKQDCLIIPSASGEDEKWNPQ